MPLYLLTGLQSFPLVRIISCPGRTTSLILVSVHPMHHSAVYSGVGSNIGGRYYFRPLPFSVLYRRVGYCFQPLASSGLIHSRFRSSGDLCGPTLSTFSSQSGILGYPSNQLCTSCLIGTLQNVLQNSLTYSSGLFSAFQTAISSCGS